jgi:hypothetical protein
MMTRCVRRTEKRPAPNYQSSVEIGVGRVVARSTLERGLARPVPLVDVSALGALTRRVAGIDKDHRHASKGSLVRDERAELVEGPRKKFSPLAARSPYPSRDALQILKDNRGLCAFSRGNELFGNTVVHVASEARFLAAKALKAAFRGSGLLRLELRAKAALSVADATESRAGVAVPFGIGGNVGDAEVYAESAAPRGLGHVNLDGHDERESGVVDAQPRLTVFSENKTWPTLERDGYVAVCGGNADYAVAKPELLRVERDASRGAKGSQALVSDESCRNLRNGGAHGIGPQRERFSRSPVNEVVQIEAAELIRDLSLHADPVATLIHVTNEREKLSASRVIGHQLQPNRKNLSLAHDRRIIS